MLCSVREKKGSVLFFNLEKKSRNYLGGKKKTRCRIYPFYEGGRVGIEICISICLHTYKETLKGHTQNDFSHTSLEEAQLYTGAWKTTCQAPVTVKMSIYQTQQFQ